MEFRLLFLKICLLLMGFVFKTTLSDHHLVGNITRQDDGDSFILNGPSCGPVKCSEFSAGAAAAVGKRGSDPCECVCPLLAPLFREDVAQCVDDIEECGVASFGSGQGEQKLPFVFLPHNGQIIHPSKEINFPGVITPICAVSGAQFLTRRGFADLRNAIDADVPFTLFRDEGRTFLQWSGTEDLRTRMSGRAVVVRLLCRDVASPALRRGAANTNSGLDLNGVFTPCVAFRVQGSPARYVTNISEVQFISNAQSSDSVSGLTVSEYVAIGISTVLLGLIYVASVFLYLHIRKKKRTASELDKPVKKPLKGLRNKNGTPIRDRDIIVVENERINEIPNDNGVIKSNPLHGRHYHELKGNFPSDSGSNQSDSEGICEITDARDDVRRKVQTTAVDVHSNSKCQQNRLVKKSFRENYGDCNAREESGIEKLPDEHVSIVDTIDSRDDKPEAVRSMGSTRRKLYFNPAYFEPQLMADPPPAAIEFLSKIREVISIARHKMAAKRFQPVLNEIPEEDTYQLIDPSVDFYQGIGSQRSSISLKRENGRRKSLECIGCPGCNMNSAEAHHNCNYGDSIKCLNFVAKGKGEKQNSIRKWLEEIPSNKSCNSNRTKTNMQGTEMLNSLLSLPVDISSKPRNKSKSLYNASLRDNFTLKHRDTASVMSEPSRRHLNIPLPEINNFECRHNNIFRNTIARAQDIRPIGLNETSVRPQPIPNQHKNKFITNKNAMPDMISEALAIENSNSLIQSSSEDEISTNKLKLLKDCLEIEADYETDSLERTVNKGFSSPTDFGDTSPSLSGALPLEEELTMRNAVFKPHSNTPSPFRPSEKPNHYESIEKQHSEDSGVIDSSDIQKDEYSLVSEVYVNNNFGSCPSSPNTSDCSFGSKKLVKTEEDESGKLTIVVQDPVENYIKIHESDGFEPDTLDRKQNKPGKLTDTVQFSRKELLNNIYSEIYSDAENENSASTFDSHNGYPKGDVDVDKIDPEYPSIRSYLLSGNKTVSELTAEGFDWNSEEGRILTLELRHSKRQRQVTPPSIKQLKSLVRPDVLPPLPPTEDSVYQQPKPPRKVEKLFDMKPKKAKDRSLSPRKDDPHEVYHTASRSSVFTMNSGYENVKKVSKTPLNASNPIDTKTFVKPASKQIKRRLNHKEDSGYLSSDSNSPNIISRKLIIQNVVSGSESDDEENEAKSESGAESIETHSVFFGSLRKLALQAKEKGNSFDSSHYFKRASNRKSKNKLDDSNLPTINST